MSFECYFFSGPKYIGVTRDATGAGVVAAGVRIERKMAVSALRAVLASGNLGQHNGLPAAIIVTTTLTELNAAAGHGITGGTMRISTSVSEKCATPPNRNHRNTKIKPMRFNIGVMAAPFEASSLSSLFAVVIKTP